MRHHGGRLYRQAFKAHLRRVIDEHGGVSAVARQAAMPPPALSRMLTSAAEPRAATLLRLAQAMGVSLSALRPTR